MSVAAGAFTTLGEDLLVLSVRPDTGKIVGARRIGYGLMGSELARLAATGRIDIVSDRIVVQDRSATGDTQLDAALASLVDTRYPPGPVTWIGLPRRGILGAYLSRLTSAGVLSEAASRLLGTPRYRVTAPERVAQARSRLDAVARSAGEPAELADTVLGALVSAIGLDGELYPGSAGRPPRASLARLARGQWTPRTMLAEGTRDPAALEASALEASVLAAVRAATCAVVQAVHNVGPHSDGPRPDATDETNRWGRSADTII